MVKEVAPTQISGLALFVKVGKALTVTLPVTLLDVQLPAFFTVKVYEIDVPDAPALKLTVIGVAGKAAFVTVVIPVPEIE
jgi:hypothetical protein